MRGKSRTLRIGSVSSGTLIPDDLLYAFLSAAEGLRLTRAERVQVRHLRQDYKVLLDAAERTPEQHETVDEMVEHLRDLLGSHVPDYCYFGAHPGDGADFGCWPDWLAIEEGKHSKEIGWGPKLPGAPGVRPTLSESAWTYYLVCNDHGNATMYRRAGKSNRWVECWSIV